MLWCHKDHSLFYVFSLDNIFKIDVRWTMWIYFFTSKCPIVALNIRSPRVDEYNAFSTLFKKSNTVQWIILCIFTCESVQEFLWVLYPEMALLDHKVGVLYEASHFLYFHQYLAISTFLDLSHEFEVIAYCFHISTFSGYT